MRPNFNINYQQIAKAMQPPHYSQQSLTFDPLLQQLIPSNKFDQFNNMHYRNAVRVQSVGKNTNNFTNYQNESTSFRSPIPSMRKSNSRSCQKIQNKLKDPFQKYQNEYSKSFHKKKTKGQKIKIK